MKLYVKILNMKKFLMKIYVPQVIDTTVKKILGDIEERKNETAKQERDTMYG